MIGIDRRFMEIAARLALRGHGGAEPNPLVGCVIVTDKGRVAGWGFHRRCGGPHAEIEAIRRAGPRARGATAYVTLEPCNHVGRTGPCSEALIEAGLRRVIFARADPSPASGGARRLREAGIEATLLECPAAAAVSDPWAHRIAIGLPWVVAKWAQTLDGRIATRAGESRWISGESSRRLVHRERGRVDAILTGIGTVVADDPLLTARCRHRRVARRVVVDPALEIPLESKLVATAASVPTIVACDESALARRRDRAAELAEAGVELIGLSSAGGDLPLADLLRRLAADHETSTVLVEAGPGLLGRLFGAGLVNEAWVFVAPRLLGDEEALPPVGGLRVPHLAGATPLELIDSRTRGGDVVLRYRLTHWGPVP